MVAADEALKAVDAGLSKDSTDLEIAEALAMAENGGLYNSLRGDRDQIAADPVFVEAWNLLRDLGFDENTTDEEIETRYNDAAAMVLALESLAIVNDVGASDDEVEAAKQFY